MWNESGGPPNDSEATLRAEIAELESRRLTVRDAYTSIFHEFGLILFKLGHPLVFVAMIAILVTDIAVILLTRSLFLALIGAMVLVGAGLYTESHLEKWVNEYNAEIDEQIRRLLAGPDEES
ncbi:MAG TPA: hypothetical protein VF337_09495 [Candidatus Limnocylindrales bacterium]